MKEIKDENNLVETKGITLIALVITIIVLLILAGITIASLTGNNGLLARAVAAKEETEKAGEKEQIGTALMGSYEEDGTISIELLNNNLSNSLGVTYKENALSDTNKIETLPAKIKINETTYFLDKNGEIVSVKQYNYNNELKSKLVVDETAEEDYKISPYIKYNGELYRVLYDMNSGYGWIEIISVNPLEKVPIGYNDTEIPSNEELEMQGYGTTNFERTRWSYNNLVTTLHKKAQKYLTELGDRARCVGSNPINPLKDTDEYYAVTDTDQNAYIKTYGYNNKFKNTIFNFYDYDAVDSSLPKKDRSQTYSLKMATYPDSSLVNNYILPSRKVSVYGNKTFFFRCIVGNDGTLNNVSLCEINSSGKTTENNVNPGLRPVIRLKPETKIKNPTAAGTADDPYELEI